MSALTPYDTGEMLEPKLYARRYDAATWFGPGGAFARRDDFGKVDFDDAEGSTICTIYAHPSTIDQDVTLVQIDTLAGGRFKIMLNDGEVYNGDPETDAPTGHVFDPDGTRDCPACDAGESPDLAEVARLAGVAFAAADGDSNDDEIQALQEALSAALAALGIEIAEEEE